MLSLTPPALHSLHSICSGGVSVSGGALGLCLDVCMCQQGGEVSVQTRGKCMEFLLCLAPGFSSASGMTVSSTASVFEESCLCLIDCVEPLPLSVGIDLCLVK